MSEEPEWRSGDPAKWGTYWTACYKLEGAKEVLVADYLRGEKDAMKRADEALSEALEKVLELGLQVKGEAWIFKTRTRSQTQVHEKVTVKELEVGMWYGRLTVKLQGLEE